MFTFIAYMSVPSIIAIFIVFPFLYILIGIMIGGAEERKIKRTEEHAERVIKSRLTYSQRRAYDERV